MLRPVLAFLGSFALLAGIGAQSYSRHTTTINAGIVILDSAKTSTETYSQSAGPFALYNLDCAFSIKPAGWSFSNPHAPSAVTSLELARWSTFPQAVGHLPALGEAVTKRSAAYWEVFLDQTADSDLSDYNLLLVNPHAYASLNPTERERLRRFVDGGGVLWIDPAALPSGINGIDQTNNFPSPFILNNNLTGAVLADFNQPLLQTPYPLTSNDINLLDNDAGQTYTSALFPPNLALDGTLASNLGTYFGSVFADFNSSIPFSAAGGNTTGSLTRIGDGFVVITARGASIKLNRPRSVSSYTANTGFYALDNGGSPVLGPDGIAAAKLAINMVSLTSESRQSQAGTRKSNSIAADLYAPLLSRFSLDTTTLAGGTSTHNQPAFYKGLMFITSGNTLYAFDAHPSTDLDGDGNPDDGIQDYSLGSPYDLVWKTTIGSGNLSSPVCAEIPNPTGNHVTADQVWVIDSNGTLYGFNALPKDPATGKLLGLTSAVPFTSLQSSTGQAIYSTGFPLAPTIDENVVYVADTQKTGSQFVGRVWMADARTGQLLVTANSGNGVINGKWEVGGASSPSNSQAGTGLANFSASPIVGYIPINDNSGGVDKVLYIPNYPNAAANAPCGFVSLWLGARGESPTGIIVNGTALQVSTRVSVHGANNGTPIFTDYAGVPDPRSVKLTVQDVGGNPWPASKMGQYFIGSPSDNGQGVLSFSFIDQGRATAFSNLLSDPTSGVSVKLDYSIDWGQNNVLTKDMVPNVIRGQLNFPDVANSQVRQVIGNVAMAPNGVAYAVVSDSTAAVAGGSYYAVQETAFGRWSILTRYDLYPKHSVTLNQALPTNYDELLFDKDPVNAIVEQGQDWVTSADRRLKRFIFSSGPTVRNGQVFVTAAAQKTIHIGGLAIPSVPVTILMAFNANPLAAEIPVGSFPSGSFLEQPDFGQSDPSSLSSPTATSRINDTDQNITYDENSGYLILHSLASSDQGTIQQCLSLSQPVIVHRPGSPDALLDPSATTGRWSPLLWYQVFQGATTVAGSSPIVTGDTVFLGMGSSVPSILNNGTFSPQGVVAATTVKIPANDPWLQALDYQDGSNGSYRAWQKQLWTLPYGSLQTTGNPYVLWPQSQGVTNFTDYLNRLNQTVIGGSKKVYGLSAGNGTLAVVGDNGVYAFDRADFLVCDEGRIARFDPSGNPLQLFQVSASSGPGAVSNAVTKKALRGLKAYDIDGQSSLIVDSGSSRILKVDRSGKELRSIDSFQFDPNYGNPTNDPNYTKIWPVEGGFKSESTHLKAPQDVYSYSEYVTGPANAADQMVTGQLPLEYWTHYIIADTGNNRLVELVDRFQADVNTREIGPPVTLNQTVLGPDGTPIQKKVAQVGVLLWHSPAAQSGRGFTYNSVNRIYVPPSGSTAGRFVYVAGIGNAGTTNTSVAAASNGLGGIVVYDPFSPEFAQVFNQYDSLPNLASVKFFDFTNGTWDTATMLNRTNTYGASGSVKVPFSNVSSVTSRLMSDGTIAIMVAGSEGLVEVTYDPAKVSSANGTLPFRWYLPSLVYKALRHSGELGVPDPAANPLDFRPTYAKRLDNGDVLVVNGYQGSYLNGKMFSGEVAEIAGGTASDYGYGFNSGYTNLGFGTLSIRFVLPPVQGVRGLVLPTFADRR